MPTGSMAGALIQVRDAIRGIGINAAAEASDLELPGVIVYPSVVTFERMDADTFTMDTDLLFVASQVRALDAVDQLEAMISAVSAVLPLRELRAVMIQLASQSPDELPAFQATITLEVTPTPEP